MNSSNRNVVVTGEGVLSPAGQGLDSTMDALVQGRSCIKEISEDWARPPYHLGARVDEFSVGKQIPPRRLRRISRLSRLALAAGHQALEGAGLLGREEVGVVLGTGLGALEETITFTGQILEGGASTATPGLFPASVMNVAASQLSMEFGLRGYNTTVNHKEVSAELALGVAMDAIRLGHADALLAGGVDELSWPVHHGYRRLHALGHEAPAPYRRGRDGMTLGEGAAVLVLEEEQHARQRGAKILARLSAVACAGGARPLVSWGPCWDGERQVGPAQEAGAQAMALALQEAGVTPEEVDLVVGSGCGSPELDRLEAGALEVVFGSRPVPVTSPHGTLGSWMSGGSVRVASALGAVLGQQIYPTLTRGEVYPEVELPGLVTAAQTRSKLKTVLACGHATGGASAAVVLQPYLGGS